MNRRNQNSTPAGGDDEVEEMLRAAEDALLLKLSVNGHMAHSTSSDLTPDLAHRFQSLKSGPPTSKSSPKSANSSAVRSEVGGNQSPAPIDDDPDDLFARFAALKSSLPKPSSSSSSSAVDPVKEESCDFNENHEDEVDKIIRWAVDAARLDPSPESDDDDGDEADTNASDSDIDSSEEDDGLHQKKKK